jgi:glutaredoxin
LLSLVFIRLGFDGTFNIIMIHFYSKVGCPPCDFMQKMLVERFDESLYVIHKFGTDEETLAAIAKFGIKTVPFVTHNNMIYKGTDLFRFIGGGIKSLEAFKPIEVITY